RYAESFHSRFRSLHGFWIGCMMHPDGTGNKFLLADGLMRFIRVEARSGGVRRAGPGSSFGLFQPIPRNFSSMTEKHLTEIRFDSFDLPRELLQGIEDAGFSHCTPIQAKALPLVLAGKDCAGQAQTGTGKTAAFLLALYQQLLSNPAPDSRKLTQPRALVLAPTRELAIQIHKDAMVLGKHTGL